MFTRLGPSIVFVLLVLIGLGIPCQVQAGRVIKVKGKKVYIKLSKKESKKISKGDKLYLTTKSKKKKKGVVIVRKKKGRKVIARLKSGEAEKGYRTRRRKRKKKRAEEPMIMIDEVASTEEVNQDSSMKFGIMGSYITMTQAVTLTPQNEQNKRKNVDMEGSMIGTKLVFNYKLSELFGLQVRGGVDMMELSGKDKESKTSETSIQYLTMDFLGRLEVPLSSSIGFFTHLGMGIYYPMSKDLTCKVPEDDTRNCNNGNEKSVIKEDSISTTGIGIFGLGLQFSLTQNWHVFVHGEYLHFPPSDTVETTSFGGGLGILLSL